MVVKDLQEINLNEEIGIVSTFQSCAAEGDILANQGKFSKAIEAYSKVHCSAIE